MPLRYGHIANWNFMDKSPSEIIPIKEQKELLRKIATDSVSILRENAYVTEPCIIGRGNYLSIKGNHVSMIGDLLSAYDRDIMIKNEDYNNDVLRHSYFTLDILREKNSEHPKYSIYLFHANRVTVAAQTALIEYFTVLHQEQGSSFDLHLRLIYGRDKFLEDSDVFLEFVLHNTIPIYGNKPGKPIVYDATVCDVSNESR